jgi:hypothetical protein
MGKTAMNPGIAAKMMDDYRDGRHGRFFVFFYKEHAGYFYNGR